MLYRLGRQIRPMVCKLNHRSFSSKRNIPIVAPWRPRSFWSETFRDPWQDFRNMERHFDELWRGMDRTMDPRYCIRPREVATKTEISQLKCDSEGFELKLDVKDFPSDLRVKLAGDKLTVSGKQEQKADEFGYVSREFRRELTIPQDVDLDTIRASISDEGILMVRADIKETEKAPEKVIDIQTEPKEKSE